MIFVVFFIKYFSWYLHGLIVFNVFFVYKDTVIKYG